MPSPVLSRIQVVYEIGWPLNLPICMRAAQPLAIVVVEELREHLAHVALGLAPVGALAVHADADVHAHVASRGTSSRRAARGSGRRSSPWCRGSNCMPSHQPISVEMVRLGRGSVEKIECAPSATRT